MAAARKGHTASVTQAIRDGKQALIDQFQADKKRVRDERVGVSEVTRKGKLPLPLDIEKLIKSYLPELPEAQINMAKKYISEQSVR